MRNRSWWYDYARQETARRERWERFWRWLGFKASGEVKS